MNTPSMFAVAVLACGCALGLCAAEKDAPKTGSGSSSSGGVESRLDAFIVAKREQADRIAKQLELKMEPQVWRCFDAAEKGDWKTFTNLFHRLAKPNENDPDAPRVWNETWPTLHEALGAYEQFELWDGALLERYAEDVIDSITPGSLYFGGTDHGRFAITLFSDDHAGGKPFFTLTQNALADGTYLGYLRAMYGKQINLPTPEDSQKAFQEYLQDAQQRLRAGQLRPGEDVKIIDNRVQVSGQVAVMAINALLVKTIVDRNPKLEVYVEESFPLDWMYPHLAPNGLILKLNRTPLAELPEAALRKDREFWKRYTGSLIGGWLDEDTSVKDICAFAEKVYLKKNLEGFKGDSSYARNKTAQKAFGKTRSAIAGVYQWRANQADDKDQRRRLTAEADFAFRQAFALCPSSPEAVFRYVTLLVTQAEPAALTNAILVLETCVKIDPDNAQAETLLRDLRRRKQTGDPAR